MITPQRLKLIPILFCSAWMGSLLNASVIQGPLVNPANGHLYYLLSQNTWTASEQEAIWLGGHLATIHDSAEQDWLFRAFGQGFGGGRLLWIGLNDATTEGTFIWSSGATNQLRFWAPGEPNNSPPGENYVALYYAGHDSQGLWNDWGDISSDPIGIPFMGVAEVDRDTPLFPLHNPVLLDFENFSGMNFNPQPVPGDSRLSDQLQKSFGVTFGSPDGAVAVINLGTGHATSGTNGIGGIQSGELNYSAPMTISFSAPGYPEIPATTEYFSIRLDQLGGGPPVTMTAYGLDGQTLGSIAVNDLGGNLLSLAIPGIHKVVIQGNGGAALDDLLCAELTPSKTIIDFENLSGMDFVAGTFIGAEARLTNQYVDRGILFSSAAGFAAILNLGAGHATSGANGFGGSTPDGLLAYDSSAPIDILFYSPTNPAAPATTDYFSVRVDHNHNAGAGNYTIEAFNLWRISIASQTFADTEDVAIINTPGIHQIRMTGSGSTAFDDVVFSPPQTALPELRIQSVSGQLQISWPVLFPEFSIESTPSLTPPIQWLPSNLPIQKQPTTFTASLNPDLPFQFFRLRAVNSKALFQKEPILP